MPTLVATVGGASSNSFATADECATYCDARSNATAWDAETDDDVKARCLIDATRDITNLGYAGLKATTTQALAWPRQLAPNPDSGFTWNYFLTTEIPQRVKDATCELALQYLKLGDTDAAAYDTKLDVIEKTVDVLTTRYAEPYQRARGLARFPRVLTFLSPLLARTTSSTEIIRG